ncbi:MAG: zinc ribbon domain-containing protein [Planctomycetaceae bacterium]|jgi:predicted  nucleic acid-binding Zn-ribbon protein
MSHAQANTLPELHRLHLAIQEVQEEIDRGPRQLRARSNTTASRLAELEAQRQKQKQLKMLADQKSLQLKTNEAKLEDLKGKLNQAASNREFDIIKGQIEADKVANSVLEDEILETLDKVDKVQAELKKLESDVAIAQAEEKKFASEVDQRRPSLEARLGSLREELQQAETYLPEEIRAAYQRLVQAHGASALSPVENATCTSCYVRLTPQNAVSIESGTIMFCRTCGRLLYPRKESA